MSDDQDGSNASSEGEHNGVMSEDQGVEEVEVDESGAHRELLLHNPSAITFGGLLPNGTGTVINNYQAINRGLNKFVQPKYFAMLLFSAAENKMPWILTEVPQKIMCNSVFVIDIRHLDSEGALFRDGLGSWIQNCGKVSNFFTWENDEVKEIKSGTTAEQSDEIVEFVRRIDKNSSCPAYTRVTVTAAQLGFAALQYFFKGDVEQEFTISYQRPKKSNTHLAHLNLANQAAILARTTRRGHKRKSSARDDDLDISESVTPFPKIILPTRVVGHNSNGPLRTPVGAIASAMGKEPLDVGAGTLIAYLREHIRSERAERVEDRKLRREELEARRVERLEDRKLQREELELRRKELQLQAAKWAVEQEQWNVERKGRDAMLDLLKKKADEA
ncbi:hypothetical protein BV898_06659 [Hypsibius exemplaris]|uniref:Uncharacterized protein n=1 Tax=Hypsibius exemplaris TaxID=2072580 RepID=A0A1W0WVL4_HYPEX|nr:hypothetical protein BV898_06659 [Hypsibius exemplaris]